MHMRVALVIQDAHRERCIECAISRRGLLKAARQDKNARIGSEDIDGEKLHGKQQGRVELTKTWHTVLLHQHGEGFQQALVLRRDRDQMAFVSTRWPGIQYAGMAEFGL